MDTDASITTDTFFNGRVKVHQSIRGYRFSIDAVLLAAAAQAKAGQRILDIGTGCGIVPILVAFRKPGIQIFAIELQASLAAIAKKNVAANHMQDRITVLNQDVRILKNETIGGTVDWVITNPPYHCVNSGRINPNSERASARHEIHLDLHELIQAARKVLRTGGGFAAIYPSERLVDLFYEMRMACIEPKWMQAVQSRQNEPARLVLVKGRMRGNPGLTVADPLIVYKKDGGYTQTVEAMMDP